MNKIKKQNIGILGPKGSYSDQTSSEYNNKDKKFFDSINEVVLSVASGESDEAIVPLENSIHGTVLETLDGVYNNNLKINKEIILDINHVLVGLHKNINLNKIKYIYSHPQALGQCKKYLQKNYPKAKLIPTLSTSFAINKIKNDKSVDSLAVGSEFAANLYGLFVINKNIQDVKNNKTLFINISKKTKREAILFTLFAINPSSDRFGVLCDILLIFKKKKINLSKVESRPSTKELGKYIFYIKADISSQDKNRSMIIKELKKLGKVTLLTK